MKKVISHLVGILMGAILAFSTVAAPITAYAASAPSVERVTVIDDNGVAWAGYISCSEPVDEPDVVVGAADGASPAVACGETIQQGKPVGTVSGIYTVYEIKAPCEEQDYMATVKVHTIRANTPAANAFVQSMSNSSEAVRLYDGWTITVVPMVQTGAPADFDAEAKEATVYPGGRHFTAVDAVTDLIDSFSAF